MSTVPYSAFPFAGPSYQAASVTVDCQRSINLYPEAAQEPGAKTPVALIGRPGLTLYGTLPNGPVRALYAGNGRLFAVGGTHVYEVNPATYSVITDFGAIPSSSGTGPAKLIVCGTGTTAQLFVLDSSTGQISYVNPVGPVVTVVFGGFSVDYLDGYLFALESGTDNKVRQSTLNDGTSWPALDYAEIIGTSDHKRTLITVNNLLWIMGQQNIEVWYNAGNAGFALERMSNGTINVGIAGQSSSHAGWTAVRVMNSVLWCGSDERGFGKFWKADGLTPVRISTPGIESLMATYGTGYLYGAYSWAEEYNGHSFYVTNFPSANSGAGATLVYDLTTGFWHERSYNNSGTPEMARPACFASLQDATNSTKSFVGDRANGNIYIQDSSYTSDNSVSIVYTRQAPHVSNQNRWVKHISLMLDGVFGSTVPQISWSDDGGTTFNTPQSMQIKGTSAASGIKTVQQWQLGRGRDRVYKVTWTTSSDLVRISAADLNIEAGIEP
jgi:hypothetical protein